MSDGTGIEYATTTWNVTTGCTHAGGPGCDFCWAKRMSKRHRGRFGYPADDPFRPTCHPERLKEPLRWQKSRRVFVTSMGDLFHDQIPYDFVKLVFDVCWRVNSDRLNTHPTRPPHTFMFLTKRPKRMGELWHLYLKERRNWDEVKGLDGLDSEVARTFWFGTSAETQEWLLKRGKELASIPAAVRWLSLEPMLGPMDLRPLADIELRSLKIEGEPPPIKPEIVSLPFHWIVCGGESGPGARPLHPDWVRGIRDQCQRATGTAFYFKQWGDWSPNICPSETPKSTRWIIQQRNGYTHRPVKVYRWATSDFAGTGDVVQVRVGKKAAGRLLDGRTWEEFPEVRR